MLQSAVYTKHISTTGNTPNTSLFACRHPLLDSLIDGMIAQQSHTHRYTPWTPRTRYRPDWREYSRYNYDNAVRPGIAPKCARYVDFCGKTGLKNVITIKTGKPPANVGSRKRSLLRACPPPPHGPNAFVSVWSESLSCPFPLRPHLDLASAGIFANYSTK